MAFFAWLGLKTWRRELIGKEKFETARRMMHVGFEVKDRFEWVRNIFTRSNEWTERVPQPTETEPVRQILNEWYAKSKRLELLHDSIQQLIEVRWEAEILFDDKDVASVKEAVQTLIDSYADISSAVSSYFDVRRDEAITGISYRDQEWMRKLHEEIYSGTQDELSQKVINAVEKLSLTVKHYVR